jgi:hypothetical protein
MAKNITELPNAAPTADTLLYSVNGSTDNNMTIAQLEAYATDQGVIYDPDGPITLGTTTEPITAATRQDTNAVNFLVNEGSGQFIFQAGAVGKVYKIEFTYVIPKTVSNEEYFATFVYNGAETVLDVSFVGNASTYAALGGSALFTVNAANDVVSINVGCTTTTNSATPSTVLVSVSIT